MYGKITKKDQEILDTMWHSNGMKGYSVNGGGGFCNLLRGNFEKEIPVDLGVAYGKPLRKNHRKGKKPVWDLSGSRFALYIKPGTLQEAREINEMLGKTLTHAELAKVAKAMMSRGLHGKELDAIREF